jgi:hypothetical protein
MRVWLRQHFVEVAAGAGSSAGVELYDASDVLLGQVGGTVDHNGRFVGEFLDADGDPMHVVAGHHMILDLSFAGASHVDLTNVTASISKVSDSVSANCANGAGGVQVQARTRDLSAWSTRTGFANGSGTFTANFATNPSFNIASGSKVDVYCKISSGDVIARTFTVP